MVAEFARRNNPIFKAYFTRKKNGDRTKHTLAVNAVAKQTLQSDLFFNEKPVHHTLFNTVISSKKTCRNQPKMSFSKMPKQTFQQKLDERNICMKMNMENSMNSYLNR